MPAITAVVGGGVIVVGYLLEARDIAELGLPIPIWQAIGSALFMCAMVAILYRWDIGQSVLSAEAPKVIQQTTTPAVPRAAAAPHPKAQLGSWEHVERFKVSEAANLWANFLPGGSYLFDKINRPSVVGAERLIVSELMDVLDTSAIPGYFNGDDYSNAYVSRADLLALAERKGVKPVFLYPKG
jgi:hypothetical protein